MPYKTCLYLQGTVNPIVSKGKREGVPYAYLNISPKANQVFLMDTGDKVEVERVGRYRGHAVATIRFVDSSKHREVRQRFQELHG